MSKRAPYRRIVKARQSMPQRRHAAEAQGQPSSRMRFLRFIAASASCSLLDQLLAGLLFSVLREPMAGTGFLRILVSSVVARVFALTLNYSLNHRLVFTVDIDDPEWQRGARRESLPRFAVLSAGVLGLSTLGVFLAHTYLGVAEWKAKVIIDIALFFLNYNVQRKWVFNHDVTVAVPKDARRGSSTRGSSR